MLSDSSGSIADQAISDLRIASERFLRSSANLTEALSEFAPADGMMTTAQQVAHAARVIDWLVEGAFRPEGFDMNFEEQIQQVLAIRSLIVARAWFDEAVANAMSVLAAKTDEELLSLLPQGGVMGGSPRLAIISAITDHTAHHRGALTTYARVNGIVPPDPFGM